jgi:hypothetical protein
MTKEGKPSYDQRGHKHRRSGIPNRDMSPLAGIDGLLGGIPAPRVLLMSLV